MAYHLRPPASEIVVSSQAMKKIAQCCALVLLTLSCLTSGFNSSRAAHPASQDKKRGAGAADAGVLFVKNCATCHGKDGQARTFKSKFIHARRLSDAKWQESVSDERLFNSIANGKGDKMPAFGKKLSEAEIGSLVQYVRHFK